ncbi:MAG TPA: phosphotransferase family protein [Planctomycetota bacterium]|nr:phosphotransferase family protein [Planctomycetota bacterium]
MKLGEFLTRETGGIARVKVLQRLAGGASRAAFALDIEIGGGPWKGRHAAVLRLDLGGRIYDASLERVEELQVISHAERGGVPVPRPLWASSDGTILGRGFLLLERVEGETIGRKIVQLPVLAEARRLLPGELGKALARIHALDPAPLEFLPRPRARGSPGAWAPALDACERARVEMDRAGGTYPGLEAGLRWLEAHAPAAEAVVLVHGDFRLGNIIVGPEGLRAVIDWEFAQVGDPHEDLAWPFVRDWRFGMDSLRFAGLSDGADFLAAYEEESGRRVDRARLRYWEALGNLRWAVGCLSQARRHTSGVEPSVELASLGRRSAEMELEMLDRIEDMALERGG